MRKIKVGIILDNPKRDLVGTLLLAYNLAKLDMEVHVIPSYNQYFEVPLLKPDALIVNYVRITNEDQLQAYKDMGIKIFVLDTEGGLVSAHGPRTPEAWAKFTFESGLYKYVDHYLFWGDALFQAFLKYSGLKERQLHLTGCPRYDVASTWKSLLPVAPKKYVLLNSNFPAINPKFSRSKNSELKNFEEAGLDREYSEKLFGQFKIVFKAYTDVIYRLIEANPHLDFLMRPHPFESEDFYKDKFAGFKNVKVECVGEIFEVLNNCYALVHCNCGSAVDSIFMNKIALQVEWINTPMLKSFVPLPSEVSVKTFSFEELHTKLNETVRNNIEKTFNPVMFDQLIKPSFAFIDGMNSVRVAEVIKAHSVPVTLKNTLKYYFASCRKKPRPVHKLMAVAYLILGVGVFDYIRNKFNEKRSSKFTDFNRIRRITEAILVKDGGRYHIGINRHNLIFPMSSFRIEKI